MLQQGNTTDTASRCVNLDWLEVFCIEASGDMDSEYFKRFYKVERRSYGTPQYAEMFTIFKKDFPFLEVRRDPYSLRKDGGIFEVGACHIRLCNNTCYRRNPIGELREFLLKFNYRIHNITRLDIALDFLRFDYTYDNVKDFINDYFCRRISKINQSNISAHGKSQWDGNTFNSVKWGALTSNVNTKIYNKSLELSEGKGKEYIRTAWINAGFQDLANVWRIEFSLKSFNTWADENGEYFANDLRQYDTRLKLMQLWYYLAEHYFHFKKVIIDENGKVKRKDRCPDVPLFNINNISTYLPKTIAINQNLTRTDKLVKKYLLEMADMLPFSKTAEYCRKICIAIDEKRTIGVEYWV